MARNRQRAKQRQAERRAERLASSRRDTFASDRAVEEADREALHEVELYSGAPPEDTGRSDTVVEQSPAAPELDEQRAEPAVETGDGGAPAAVAARGRRREPEEQRHHRNRLIAFLIAVWAELQRVEWPDRQTLTMLTGVVLLFVVVMGVYLGVLDAIFSRVINKIL